MASKDIQRVCAKISNGTRTYVIRGRRKDVAHDKDELPWFVAIFRPDQPEVVYTTDVSEAQCFSSLISADTYAVYLDDMSKEHVHAVDVLNA